MLVGHEIVEFIDFAEGNEKGEHHGKSSENGAGNEVGREDSGVPTRDNRGRKIERDNAVHRENKGRRDSGKNQVSLFVMGPVTIRASPAQGQQAIDHLTKSGSGPIAERGEVRDEPEIPENE